MPVFREARGIPSSPILIFLCATSVSSVSLWLISLSTTETQRTQRLHREDPLGYGPKRCRYSTDQTNPKIRCRKSPGGMLPRPFVSTSTQSL